MRRGTQTCFSAKLNVLNDYNSCTQNLKITKKTSIYNNVHGCPDLPRHPDNKPDLPRCPDNKPALLRYPDNKPDLPRYPDNKADFIIFKDISVHLKKLTEDGNYKKSVQNWSIGLDY